MISIIQNWMDGVKINGWSGFCSVSHLCTFSLYIYKPIFSLSSLSLNRSPLFLISPLPHSFSPPPNFLEVKVWKLSLLPPLCLCFYFMNLENAFWFVNLDVFVYLGSVFLEKFQSLCSNSSTCISTQAPIVNYLFDHLFFLFLFVCVCVCICFVGAVGWGGPARGAF